MSDRESGVAASNVFEAELRRQILASEKGRATIQALIGGGLFLIAVVVAAIHFAVGFHCRQPKLHFS